MLHLKPLAFLNFDIDPPRGSQPIPLVLGQVEAMFKMVRITVDIGLSLLGRYRKILKCGGNLYHIVFTVMLYGSLL